MSKHYYCDFCNGQIVFDDYCGVKWIGDCQTGDNLYAPPIPMIIQFYLHNNEAETHICHECRRKIKGVTKDESNIKI